MMLEHIRRNCLDGISRGNVRIPVHAGLQVSTGRAKKTDHFKKYMTLVYTVRTSIWSILYSGELYIKNCIVKTSETLIVWRAFCYTAGSDKSDAIKGVPDKLLKGAAMVFGYIVDMMNCCWPTDLHSQQWLSILRQLRVIIECHA